MKKITTTQIIIATMIFLMGCASLQSWYGKLNPALKQSFGDALRSLEGAAVADIPKAIMALRAKWLPAGKVYDDLAASQIRAYLAAHPQTNVEIAKVLEALATSLQATP